MAISSRTIKIAAIIIIAVILVAVVYVALTFPRTIVDFPVAFSTGLDLTQQEFEVPALHDKAQVKVTITSGESLWRAAIINQNGEELWSNATIAQENQTTYYSAWIPLPSQRLNVTFSIINGSLNAEISITSKGGFW